MRKTFKTSKISDSLISSRLPICISSIYQRENDFILLRQIAADVIRTIPICMPVRCPEDKMPEREFNEILRNNAICLIVIIGSKISHKVTNEINIAIERGIPVIPLLKANQTSSGFHASPSAKKFLDKYPFLLLDERLYFHKKEEFSNLLKERLWRLVKEKFEKFPIFTENRSRFYEEALSLINKKPRRIILVQQTSTLILGPRKGCTEEINFYNKLFAWLENNCLEKFFHLFSWEKTANEIKKRPHEYDIKKSLQKIKHLLKLKPVCRMRFTSDALTPILIINNSIAIGTIIGKEKYSLVLPTALSDGDAIKKFVGEIEDFQATHLTKERLEKLTSFLSK